MLQFQERFTYTADRSSYLGTVSVFGALVLIEGTIVSVMLALLVPAPLKFFLLAGQVLLVLYACAYMLSPLWTGHRLDGENLYLRYGIHFKAVLPRRSIVRARPVREKMEALQATGAGYDAKKHRITAAFSGQGQVLLELDRPYPMRTGWFGGGLAEQVLINLDRRDAFLAALGFAGDDRSPAPVAPVAAPAAPAVQVQGRIVRPAPANTADPPVIRTEALTRRYSDFTAVNQLNLLVRPGEIYGFLGANGAGKTSTIKMLVGLMEPSAGRAWINGHDVWAEPMPAKAVMGYVPDRSTLYERLTGREFLTFLAQMRGIPQPEANARIRSLLELLELTQRADDLSRIYSFGMKRKLALAGALLHRPRVLILDEPLNGLDPRSARNLKDFFAATAAEGTAIFLSIHDLATAEQVCHRVGIIHQGTLVAEGTAEELRQLAGAPNLEAVFLHITSEQAEGVS